MILDQKNMFADGQILTAASASEKVLDFGPESSAANSSGTTMPLLIHMPVDAVPTTGTIKIDIRTSSTVDAETGRLISPVVIQSVTATVTDIVGGKYAPWTATPPGLKRYVDLAFTPIPALTAGKITAGLVVDWQIT